MEVGATSHGLTGAVSPFGNVTSLRPLRRLLWIGTDKVSLPSLVCRMSGSPVFWMRMSLRTPSLESAASRPACRLSKFVPDEFVMPVLPLVARPARGAAPAPGVRCHLRAAALQDRWGTQ